MSSTAKKTSAKLIDEIEQALKNVSYGSIELYVQDKVVTQITVRSIKKTSVSIQESIQPKAQPQKQAVRQISIPRSDIGKIFSSFKGVGILKDSLSSSEQKASRNGDKIES